MESRELRNDIAQTNPKASPPKPRPKLSDVIPQFFLGCAAFSPQINNDPHKLPIETIISRALELGFRGFDTSPYYGDSETLLGTALHALESKQQAYTRSDTILMTKVGRVSANKFDYTPDAVTRSVHRSLARFHTTYLDVVFCHDVEFVSADEVLAAVEALFRLVDEGRVRYVGISGYPPLVLAGLCEMIQRRLGRGVDAVQSYCHFTLQNTTLQEHAARLRRAGVDVIFTASPLAMGLLRSGGVPIAGLGDWHPAPPELRARCQEAAEWVEGQGGGSGSFAALANRFVASGWVAGNERTGGGAGAIFGGCSSVEELETNWRSIESATELDAVTRRRVARLDVMKEDERLVKGVRAILGDWVDFAWDSPGDDWKRE